MNRVIKFRAWNKKTNEMVDQINELGFDNSFGDSKPHTITFDFFNGNFDTECWFKDDFELMQFTGLTDKNGVDIYEKMEIDGLYNVKFKDGSYVLIDISNGDIVLLYNYISSRSGNVEITKEYTGI